MKRWKTTVGMSREEWLSCRRQGIGGSDAGAICGLNPYASALTVYLDKIGELPEKEDTESMRQGRDLEEYVAARFMEETGKKVRRANAIFQDDEYPFLIADVDRLIVGEKAGLECKTASPYNASHWEDGHVPDSYYLQCQHYMMVTRMECWYLAVLMFGREFKDVPLERDEELIGYLRTIEVEFWQNHVCARNMPDPDGSRAADEVLARYFPEEKEDSVEMPGFDLRLKRRTEIGELIEKLEAERRQIEQEVKKYLADRNAQHGISSSYRVSWKEIVSSRLDTKRLKEEQPEVYQRYQNQNVSQRLTIKAA